MPSKEFFDNSYEYAGALIRKMLLSAEPSAKDHWFHKPIGIPKLINWEGQPGQRTPPGLGWPGEIGLPVEWYWGILNAAFPESTYVTCLRNPWDVVFSWERFAGWRQLDIWRDVILSYRILEWKLSQIQQVIFFDDIANGSFKVIHDLFEAIGVVSSKDVKECFDKPVSMKPGLQLMKNYAESWNTAVNPCLNDEECDLIVKIWKSFGREFRSPRRFTGMFEF